MPTVRMPDGALVDMPDNPSPELRARLEKFLSQGQPQQFDSFHAPSIEDTAGQVTEPVTQAPPQRSWSDVPGEALSNLPSGAVKFGKNIAQSVLHPIDTAKVVGSVFAGGLGKGAQALGMTPTSPENVENFDSVIEMYKKDYGSIEGLKNKIATDPVGFMADISTVLGAGGALASKAGFVKTGGAFKAASGAVDPIGVVKNAAKLAAKAIPESVPQKLYASAAKLPTTMKPAKRAQVIGTALDEGIIPTKKGIEKLNSTIDDLNKQIDEKIVGPASRGEVIDSAEVAKRIDEIKPRFANQALPKEDLDILDAAKDQFTAWHGQTIPVDKAQEIKKGTYTLLRQKYGKIFDARTEAEKSLARGIKEELANRYPELTGLNAREGKLIELNNAIERSVARIENLNLIGIGSPIAGAAGAAVTGDPKLGAITAAAKAIIDNPKMKSGFAVALHQARTKGFSVEKTGKQQAALGAYQAGRIKEEEEKKNQEKAKQ